MNEQLLQNGDRGARRRVGRRCSDHGGGDPGVVHGTHRSRIHGYTFTGLLRGCTLPNVAPGKLEEIAAFGRMCTMSRRVDRHTQTHDPCASAPIKDITSDEPERYRQVKTPPGLLDNGAF